MKKIALVHEYLTRLGGAERVLKQLWDIYPEADIYTLLYNDRVSKVFPKKKVHTSFLQKLPKFLRNRPKFLGFLYPTVIESFDLSQYDLIISSTNSFAKGVVINSNTKHISYCHAPTTFIWDEFFTYKKDQKKGWFINFWISLLAHYLRQWDRQAVDRVDILIANSRTTQARIKKYYRKDSILIYPPVDVNRIKPTKDNKGFFLIVSQLTPYKKIDVAIEAFNKLGLPLVIIGDGPDKKRLEKLSESNIKFKGFLNDDEIVKYYQNCRAFIFAGKDDFGIAPVEAMAAGKPVLAYRQGGATETVIEGVTGEFFDSPIVELLADGVRRIIENEDKYNPDIIRKRAEEFGTDVFIKKIKNLVEEKI